MSMISVSLCPKNRSPVGFHESRWILPNGRCPPRKQYWTWRRPGANSESAVLEVLLAEEALTHTRFAYLAALARANQAEFELQRATGGKRRGK